MQKLREKLIATTPSGETRIFDACIFDFDGVIADTEKYHFASWNKAFSAFGVQITESEYLPLKSTGKANIIGFAQRKCGKTLSESDKAEISAIKDASFKELIKGISTDDILPGATELLSSLREKSIKTAVASSASTTAELIIKFDLGGFFNAVIDGRDGYAKKPAPDIFLAAAKRLGASPEKCLVFEDSIAGIEAATACGMSVVAVGGIKHENALLCVNSLTELAARLEIV